MSKEYIKLKADEYAEQMDFSKLEDYETEKDRREFCINDYIAGYEQALKDKGEN